ncbi:MAG TPA: F0F1 ATP synthase subunit epsilon [candidate division Zixibacteria bacterium]|nr:F0F1 ATP synthase subunit epsilon [candidate division Zixibacteria bacterium]
MRLKVLLPKEVLLDEEISKVTAEAPNGEFCLLPKHIDFVSALAPGVLIYVSGGKEFFVAVDGGVLVKKGDRVMVSSPRAVRGTRLGELEETVLSEFIQVDEKERKSRSVLARLEADIVRNFIEME